MPNLFNTFSRTALVAIGLALAPAAFAQGTFNACPSGFTPIFTGVGTQNLEATCGVTCPSGQVASVNGNTVSCSGGTPVDVVPAGCTLTASPTSGSVATNVTLTYKCTSGTLPISVAWQGGTPPGNCLDSMDALTKTCTVPGVSQTTTWTVSQFSNSVGNGSNNANKSATFTFQQGGGGDFANCPSGTNTVSDGWGTSIYTQFSEGTTYSYKLVVPTTNLNTSKIMNDWGPYGGGADFQYSMSTTACDFDGSSVIPALDGSGYVKPGSKLAGSSNSYFSVIYKVGQNIQSGGTYFFNVRATACTSGLCGEIGNLQKPVQTSRR
jgi:hypothetical protein